MGVFKPEYNIGDVLGYYDPKLNRVGLVEIGETEVKRCTGDILPHRYYSGCVVAIETSPESGILHSCETGIINVRERNIFRVDLDHIALAWSSKKS